MARSATARWGSRCPGPQHFSAAGFRPPRAGAFSGRSKGSPATAAPGLQNTTRVSAPNAPFDGSTPRFSPQLSASVLRDLPHSRPSRLSPPLSSPETNARFGMNPAGRRPLAWTSLASISRSRPAQPYSSLAELSDRLTHIARSKGLLSVRAIDVYVSNNSPSFMAPSARPATASCWRRSWLFSRRCSRLTTGWSPSVRPRPRAEVPSGGKDRGLPDGSPHVTGIPGSHHEPGSAPGKHRGRGNGNSLAAPSRLSIRPRTPRPSPTRSAACLHDSAGLWPKLSLKIAPG